MTARSALTFQLVATVSSKTRPDKEYEIARHRSTGKLSCNCMSYAVASTCPTCGERTQPVKGDHDHCRCRYHGEVERSCKHLRGYLQSVGQTPVAKPKTTSTPKPAQSPVEMALFTAISSLSFRLKLSDTEWRAVASRLEKHLPTTPTFTAPVETLVDEGLVRRIVLED